MRTKRDHCWQAQNPWVEVNGPAGGRGMCEGWSLEIGMAFGGSVVRRDIGRERRTWIASINSTGLGEFLERGITMRRAEELDELRVPIIQWNMSPASIGRGNGKKASGLDGLNSSDAAVFSVSTFPNFLSGSILERTEEVAKRDLIL
jgi:hypothetical protein